MTPREPTELHDAVDGDLACSHPGQFAVADVDLDGGRRLTVVSLYGIWDRMLDSGDNYVEATLHRAISDLTVVLQERSAEYVLVAGDLNIYSYSDRTMWGDRRLTVLSRFAAYGLEICGPFRRDGKMHAGADGIADHAVNRVVRIAAVVGESSPDPSTALAG
jgi:hypothetical protein